ncbi:hypothetical protein FBY26_3217 [Phycicoccus sp. SLBN-51]|nr:hypothetical protein FBY26_3217 [Phycicoccus sp. SLBN-51]
MTARSGRSRRPRLVRAAVALAAVLSVLLQTACATPAFDRGAYLQNAKGALESATSEARTAELAASARLSDRATRAYADTVITSSEKAMGPIQTSFGGVDPASRRDDALRDTVLGMLGDTEDTLAQARIAVRRDDRPMLERARIELAELGQRLQDTRDGLP